MKTRLIAAASALIIAGGCFAGSSEMLAVSASETKAVSSELEFSLRQGGTVNISGDGDAAGTETFDMYIDVKKNPGVQSWVLLLDFDSTAFTLKSYSAGVFKGLEVYKRGGTVTINDYESGGDITSTGEALRLRFALKEGAKPGNYKFSLRASEDADNFFNLADEPVTAVVSSGEALETVSNGHEITADIKTYGADAGSGVTLSLLSADGAEELAKTDYISGRPAFFGVADGSYKVYLDSTDLDLASRTIDLTVADGKASVNSFLCYYGDLNNDKERNNDDVIILQQLSAKWRSPYTYYEAANVDTKDDELNNDDVILLQQYNAKWRVKLGGNRTV